MRRCTLFFRRADGTIQSWDGQSLPKPPGPVPSPGDPTARILISSVQFLAVTCSGAQSSEGASGASIVSYTWNFGDGTAATGPTATHTYTAAGTYLIRLSVTDSYGVVNTTGATVSVQQHTNIGPNIPSFIWSQYPDSLAISVDGRGSSDPDGTIVSWQWDFGDGGAATGAQSGHTYAQPGTYTIRLTVTDDAGATNTATQQGTIVVRNQPPLARLSVTTAGMSATYDASASSDPNGDPLTYDVDWGDGGLHSTGVRDGHTYSTVGPWTVTLTVTDSKGGTAVAVGTASPTQPAPPPGGGGGGGGGGSAAGDPGTNQTGTNNQQVGSGIVLEQSLSAGSDLTGTLAGAGTSVVSFPAGTFTWRDFTHGVDTSSAPSGNNATGLRFPNGIKGVLGAGSKSTLLEMVANSSTKGSTVPVQGSGATNQLQYADVDAAVDGFLWDGINLVGTPQGHLYNGLRLRAPGNATFQNSTFSGIPGSSGSPPGETFMVNVYAQAAGKTITFKNCTFESKQLGGSGVAAAQLGTNNTRGTINIVDCLFLNSTYSAGPTIWELAAGGTINIIRPVTKNCHRNIGNEAQGGTINIYDPLFGDPVPGEDDIRVTWTSNYNSGTINVYFTSQAKWNDFIANRTNKKILTQCTTKQNYGGSAGGAYTGTNAIRNFLHIFIGGVEQPLTNYWSISGS